MNGVVSRLITCAACGAESICPPGCEGHSIHRDGYGRGPEVDLCHGCGAYETPSCPELWERIAQRDRAVQPEDVS